MEIPDNPFESPPQDMSLFVTSQELELYMNNPVVPETTFFPVADPAPTPAPAPVTQPSSNTDQTVALLIKILEQLTQNNLAEDRKRLEFLESQVTGMKQQLDFLVGKREAKLERGSRYRENKKRKIGDFYAQK